MNAVLFLVPLCTLLLPGADPRAIFASAEQALRSNDLNGAERGFREFLELKPDHLAALGNLGVVYSRMGRYHDAISTYGRALKLAPQSADLNLNFGLAWLKQDEHRRARTYFERAATLRPDHAQIRELLATTQLFTGDVAKAVENLESLPAAPAVDYLLSIGYLKQNRREKAQAAVARLFQQLSPAQAHLLSGRAYYESTLFEEALAELTKARALQPDLPGVWRESGKTQVSLRRSDEAQASLREALRCDPADAESAYFLGALLVQEGSVQEGVSLLERSKAARPDFWGNWHYLGKAALAAGEPAQAVEFLRRAAELRPDELSVLYQLSRALKVAGNGDESRKVLQRYTELREKTRVSAEEALVLR